MSENERNASAWVKSGCPDCGNIVYHPQPGSYGFSTTLKKVFADVNMEVFEDPTTKHYIVILRTKPTERMYASCKQPLFGIPSVIEENEILDWAKSLKDEE